MLRILVIKRRHLYIVLGLIIALVIGILFLTTFFRSDETFSETFKYAYNKITADQAKVLITQNKDLTILDIRMENDYLEGHIPDSILMPYKVIKKKYSDFERENKYLVYCENGKNSEKIAKTMSKDGFSQIFVLAGGIESWNYELTK